MVPLSAAAVRHVRSWLGEPEEPGLLDLHHALAYHRLDLWGDDVRTPQSVLLFREGIGQSEAFGAGRPEPSVSWLLEKAWRTVTLHAPKAWYDVIERQVDTVERDEVLILSAGADDLDLDCSPVATRRMLALDEDAFVTGVAPEWALFSWRTFPDLVKYGAGYVVPFEAGYAALAWVYSLSERYDTIGVSTVPRFRRLGLGRAAASTLVRDIVHRRKKVPLWTTTPQNVASQALAKALGFSRVRTETVLRWHPRPGAPARSIEG